jgi:hypothetical protein
MGEQDDPGLYFFGKSNLVNALSIVSAANRRHVGD